MEHQKLGKSAMSKRGPSIEQVGAVYDELVLWVMNEEMGLQALRKSAMGKRGTSIVQAAAVYGELVMGVLRMGKGMPRSLANFRARRPAK